MTPTPPNHARTWASIPLILTALLTFAAPELQAQEARQYDQIVLTQGEVLRVTVEEVLPTTVKYRLAAEPDGPLYRVEKSEVKLIIYRSGRVEEFAESDPAAPDAAEPAGVTGAGDTFAGADEETDRKRGRVKFYYGLGSPLEGEGMVDLAFGWSWAGFPFGHVGVGIQSQGRIIDAGNFTAGYYYLGFEAPVYYPFGNRILVHATPTVGVEMAQATLGDVEGDFVVDVGFGVGFGADVKLLGKWGLFAEYRPGSPPSELMIGFGHFNF